MIEVRHHRKLGSTGLTISPIGLGTVKFGRDTGLKYPNTFRIPDAKSLLALLTQAAELGINFIDTAPAYGSSEKTLGKLLKQINSPWHICTKVGEYHINGQSHYDFSTKATETSIENSLRNLNTDALELVLVHSDGNDKNIIEQSDVFETLLKLKDKGLIKHLGMSTKTVAGGTMALQFVEVLMISLNESDLSQATLIALAKQHNKGVLIKKSLQSGNTLKPSKAINFAANYPGVTSVILGTINKHHLQSNIDNLQLRT